MDERQEQILSRELRGERITDIADAIGIAINTVNYHRNKPDYQEELKRRISSRSRRGEMTLQERVEAMLTTVIGALEEELDGAETNLQRIGLTDKLKDLTQVVGKPEQRRELGVVEVPGLLTAESFNRHDGSGGAKPTAVPVVIQSDSLRVISEDKEDPMSPETQPLPYGHETPTPVHMEESYPQDDELPEDEIPLTEFPDLDEGELF